MRSNSAHTDGSHTRNRKITNWTTCENCPAERKRACCGVCSEMERYLGANAHTTTHNSPTPNQAQQTVEEMTYGLSPDNEEGRRTGRLSALMSDFPRVVVTETPESLLVQGQMEQETLPQVLLFIDGYCKEAAKGNARKRSILESIIILYFLEGYSTAQITEILGKRWQEFRGYKECTRKTGAKAGYVLRTPKNAYKVWRVAERFQRSLGGLSPRFKISQ